MIESDTSFTSKNTRVTVGVVSGDIQCPHAKKCINRIKKHTENYDLIILDNNMSGDFNHSTEMNRILAITKTRFLVLMDDDVFVDENWLDGMLRCVTNEVGVVTPMFKDKRGQFSYAGIKMDPSFTGHHSHIMSPVEKPTRVQTICMALTLIDISKCGQIRLDESYSKYFIDIDYGFLIWEAGYQIVCSPYTLVTHIGGATLAYETKKSHKLVNEQREIFFKKWVDSGRHSVLVNDIWPRHPDIAENIKSSLRNENQQSVERLRGLLRQVPMFHKIYRWTKSKLR